MLIQLLDRMVAIKKVIKMIQLIYLLSKEISLWTKVKNRIKMERLRIKIAITLLY